MKDRRRAEQAFETIETTIGELIETILQVAHELGNSDEESYELASIAVGDLLRRNHKDLRLSL